MHFCFVLTNLAGGGAEKAILKLAGVLQARGHQVRLLLLENRIEHAPPADILLETLSERAPRGWLGKRRLAWRLARRLKALGPQDLIVSTLPFADEVTALARVPRHVCRIANTLSAELARLPAAKAARRRARYQALYGMRPLVAVSAGVATDLRTGLGLNSAIHTIPNLFDPAALQSAAAEAAPLPDRPYVIHVGRFAPQKRHDLLLAAWQQVATEHLLVLLTAPDPALSAIIAAHGLTERVVVAGFQTNPYPWIAGADLLVLCSDHEGLPNVLIEALLCGTPAVSTDCPSGPREILAAFPECLVPCGDSLALAGAIRGALASSPEVTRANLVAYGAEAVARAYESLAEAA